MYKRILVALENGPADRSLVPHVAQLASLLDSELLLIHVADGWVARHYDDLKLAESDEMKADREYLQQHADGARRERVEGQDPPGAGQSADRNSQGRRAGTVRSDRDDHARPPPLRRSVSRQHDHGRQAQEPDSDAAGARRCGLACLRLLWPRPQEGSRPRWIDDEDVDRRSARRASRPAAASPSSGSRRARRGSSPQSFHSAPTAST